MKQEDPKAPLGAATGSPTATNPASLVIVSEWEAAGSPAGAEWVAWANAAYRRHVRDSDSTWNAHLSAALGAKSKPEQMTCRIF